MCGAGTCDSSMKVIVDDAGQLVDVDGWTAVSMEPGDCQGSLIWSDRCGLGFLNCGVLRLQVKDMWRCWELDDAACGCVKMWNIAWLEWSELAGKGVLPSSSEMHE